MGNCGEKGHKVAILETTKFRGRSVARLDAKGRLRIPAKFREVLQNKKNNYTDALVITRYEECLVAYPPEKWEELESKAENLSQFNSSHRSFMRHFVSAGEPCEFDSQGRILIPPLLREEARFDQEVMLVGMLSTFEIWNKAAYEIQVGRDKENEPKIMENVANSGL